MIMRLEPHRLQLSVRRFRKFVTFQNRIQFSESEIMIKFNDFIVLIEKRFLKSLKFPFFSLTR